MRQYAVEPRTLFAFLEEHYPNTNISFENVEVGDTTSVVHFRAYVVRYYAQREPANDFAKSGRNTCYPGRWNTEKDEEYQYEAVHSDYFSVELDNETLRKLGLIVH